MTLELWADLRDKAIVNSLKFIALGTVDESTGRNILAARIRR